MDTNDKLFKNKPNKDKDYENSNSGYRGFANDYDATNNNPMSTTIGGTNPNDKGTLWYNKPVNPDKINHT